MTTIDEVIETHVSWVSFQGDRAYKRKKPVRNGFLDFSTLTARRIACEEELRVNRRLAPDVYLRVDPVIGCTGEIVDYVVVMRRMPADCRLSSLVTRGVNVDSALRQVAHRVAALHLNAKRSVIIDAAASPESTLARWEANYAEMEPLAGLLADRSAANHSIGLARRYVAGHQPLFRERVRAGRSVDGHGDLLADDIFVLPDGPRILDAIEFDAGLRYGDGLADIGFLAMDLERLGSPDAARRLFAWYAEFSADRWPASLAHFYVAYRAQVRAKVACLRAAQEERRTASDATALLDLAVGHLAAGRSTLILVGGPPATGKSTIAAGLGSRHKWMVLRSDEVRKELAGLAASARSTAPLGGGVYSPAMTALTYGELLHRAAALLEMGESVVLDATWSDPVWRDAARRLAQRLSSDIVELRCSLPVAIASVRARRRLGGDDPSDAGPEIAVALSEGFAAWPEATLIDNAGSPDTATDMANLATTAGAAG